jgi:glycosyltransferase involved in cell wall biosynthesis
VDFWAVVVARNAAQHLPQTINSILKQKLSPTSVTVVDDGSTDESPIILNGYAEKTKGITVLRRPNLGYDIRRVPSNINLAWKYNFDSGLKTRFFMISGDDCVYPDNYASELISRMQANSKIVVASGHPSTGGNPTREHSPSGSGRMIDCNFWTDVEGYPLKAGWETWLLYKAAQRGLRAVLYDDLTFDHARPRGAQHQFTYWGAAMGGLGYHPLYAIGRITKNALVRSIGLKGCVNLIRGYLLSELGSDDSFISPFEKPLREFVFCEQSRRISHLVSSLL